MIFVLIHTDLQSGWVDATESQSQCADLRQSELTDFTEKCVGMGTYSEYLTLDFNFHPVWEYQTCWAKFRTHYFFNLSSPAMRQSFLSEFVVFGTTWKVGWHVILSHLVNNSKVSSYKVSKSIKPSVLKPVVILKVV